MPTYGYECIACKNQIEVFQSIKDAPLVICESCGGTLRKLIYPVGIAFKGSGFYVNDYASKSGKSTSDSSSAPSTETKTEAPKTETPQPAASTTAAPKTEAKTPAAS